MAPNGPEWLFLQYGAALAGLTLVTLNPALRPSELHHVLRDSQVSEHRGSPLRRFLDEVRPRVPSLREVVDLGDWGREHS